jgi:hypothetical protein
MKSLTKATPTELAPQAPVVDLQAPPADLKSAVPFDSFDWEQLCGDVMTLRAYGEREYSAVAKVYEAFRFDFLARLRAELKQKSRAQWQEETFERLKSELSKQ